MAFRAEDVQAEIDATNGRKAKRKKLQTEPENTKERKLPSDLRKGLETHFGSKLNRVRVHVGGNSTDLCKQLKTKTFTIGNDIYVKKPAFAKDSRLLAHELAHVLQQGRGKMPKPRAGTALTSK